MIQKATVQDLPNLICILEDYFNSSVFANEGKFSRERVKSVLLTLIDNPLGLVSIKRKETEIVGVLIACAVPSLSEELMYAHCLVWFVRSEYRKTLIGASLLKSFFSWMRVEGLDVFVVGQQEGSDYSSMFKKLKAKPVEHLFRGKLSCLN